MRVLVPFLLTATPALAHTTDLPHGHSADWAVPVALLLIGLAVFVSKRKAVRIKGQRK